MEAVGGSPLIAGNKVTLLVDGPAIYAAMSEAIQHAKDHVNLETFIFEGDESGQRFADLLLTRQAEGAQVSLIYDSYGSLATSAAFFERLRQGGVRTLEFNPIDPLKTRGRWLLGERDHRKNLIADGTVAFTGGVNISGVYSGRSVGKQGHSKSPAPWRDTHVRIEGPAVGEFQKLFLETWKRQKGPEFPERNYFPPLKREGDDFVQVIASAPGERKRVTYIMYVSAVASAAQSIHMTNAYFVPDRQMIDALTAAARRGVDVKIVLPGFSDSNMAFFAGRSFYTELLRAGVKLYERLHALLHAKTAVIDSVWSTVGSTNLDFWSFLRNDEVNAVILSRDFAAEMEAMFSKDLEESKEILLEDWEGRPLSDRLREWFYRRFSRWL